MRERESRAASGLGAHAASVSEPEIARMNLMTERLMPAKFTIVDHVLREILSGLEADNPHLTQAAEAFK